MDKKLLSKIIVMAGMITSTFGNSLPPCPENSLPPCPDYGYLVSHNNNMLKTIVLKTQNVRE